MQMRTQAPRASVALCTLGALFLPTVTASAQTPLEIEEAARQALISMERDLQDAATPTNASFTSVAQESNATDVPSEGYFFDDEEPRAFWRSQNGRRIVHPVTAPTYNDDAYITSDVRGHYINHQFPTNGSINSGAARVYGAQIRYAIDESLQLQISKLGAADVHVGSTHEFGADDLALAIKYAFIQDWDSQTHASIGLGYELGIGREEAFGGDDEFRLFGAWNQGFDRSHIGLSVNGLFATGSEDASGDSDRLSAHLHFDYEVSDMFSPLAELNYYKTLSNGDNVSTFSGLDLANFGGNEDEDALSLGLGGELRFERDLSARLAYETPLTSNNDLWGYRWTASLVWRF